MNDKYQIKSIAELRKVIVTSQQQDNNLVERLYDFIDEHARKFISDSPLVFFATADKSGHVDVSPKGDAPSFIEVLDDKMIAFPERPGNTDARNFRNILENDQVSLIFVVPRANEVLRVTGRAIITKDPDLLGRMVSCGKPALLCIKINVEECFFHCGRAFNRSHIWVPEKWPQSQQKYLLDQISQRRKLSKQAATELEQKSSDFLKENGESSGAY
jgi:PPOX class probable FMN-dependent enzyme